MEMNMEMGIPADQIDTSAPLPPAGDVYGASPEAVSPAQSHNAALRHNGKRPKGALLPERLLGAARPLR
jgi:hypothetical protein